jgi:PTS system nitrogen regulatory IIA component
MQFTVRDVSMLLSVPEKIADRWIHQGYISAFRANEQYRFHRAELLEWATAYKPPMFLGIFAHRESDTEQLLNLGDSLQAGRQEA